jgi:hypothetical protein
MPFSIHALSSDRLDFLSDSVFTAISTQALSSDSLVFPLELLSISPYLFISAPGSSPDVHGAHGDNLKISVRVFRCPLSYATGEAYCASNSNNYVAAFGPIMPPT